MKRKEGGGGGSKKDSELFCVDLREKEGHK